MLKKIIVKNEDKPFTVKFNGTDFLIPTGTYECERTVGSFILQKGREWGLKVSSELVDNEIKKINEVEEVSSDNNPTEEPKEEKKSKNKTK